MNQLDPWIEMLTEDEAAAVFGVSRQTLRRWRKRKIGPPFYRLPGHKTGAFYRRADLLAWIESGRIETKTPKEQQK